MGDDLYLQLGRGRVFCGEGTADPPPCARRVEEDSHLGLSASWRVANGSGTATTTNSTRTDCSVPRYGQI